MARHNYVKVTAFVKKAPKVKDVIDGRAGIIGLTTIMNERDYNRATTGYQLNSVSFVARSQDETVLKMFEELKMYDIVDVVGFLATKEVEKEGTCPFCQTKNSRRYACVAANPSKVKAGGNEVFVYPISIKKRYECETEQEAFEYLHANEENINTVFMLGNLTGQPVHGFLNNGTKQYTRFQLAINRKFCPKGGSEVYDRTDYPWVYSYGNKAIDDYENLEKGALVYVDGALQARKYKEQYKCQCCGEEFDVPGRTLEVLAYDTEYLRLPRPVKSDSEESKVQETTI